jgi:hypothetical protein
LLPQFLWDGTRGIGEQVGLHNTQSTQKQARLEEKHARPGENKPGQRKKKKALILQELF